ncbi:MAG TPA: hypothetical protein VD861_17720 [Pyrinomonadaceae bacterium]|jgi:tetratricopeptide (TPR) repeat protein|nr:hypothetical protein [Pyrinomonadaceae bacterium]
MYFWRDKYFKSLTEAANYASAIPAWAEYARFCELLEKGLRKDAFAHLESFIESAAQWPLSEKQKFVSWLYHFAYEHRDDSYLLMPHPLRVKFLEPTLVEWIAREPESGEPHRWLGTLDHLEEAIRLDPRDEIACERMASYLLNGVGNALSHLSCCKYYAGNPEEDLQALEKVESLIEGLSEEGIRARHYVEMAELKEGVKDYLRGKTET